MSAGDGGLALALTIARRELRSGLTGFRVFLAALALGVAAIAAVGSLSAAVDAALKDNAKALLGGDLALDLTHREASPAEAAALAAAGEVSSTADLRAMTRAAAGGDTGKRLLVELKAVDRRYPLYGTAELSPPLSLAAALGERDGIYGAVAEADLLARLGLKLGQRIKLGEAIFELRAVLAREPDRAVSVFILGPRLMIALAALPSTKLVQPGSIVHYDYRLALPPGGDARAELASLERQFPDAGWRGRSFADATPRLEQFLDRVALYLTLVGLATLLVGGIGVANAVRTYLEGRGTTIAILKCLGAPQRLIFRIYLVEVMAIAALGILIGLALGASVPFLVAGPLARLLPVTAEGGLYPLPLLLAAAYGVLTTLAFTLWPLAAARDVAPARLFRGAAEKGAWRPRRMDALALLAAAAALALLAVLPAADKGSSLWFVSGAVVALASFRGAAALIAAAARRAAPKAARLPTLRLALANLMRPGAPSASVMLSLGLGLTLLVAVGLVEGNIAREVSETIPKEAPSYFFIDIQPDELAGFDQAVRGVAGTSELEQVPSLRGRIVALNGVPAEKAKIDPRAAWVLDGDRGLTYAATPPPGTRIVAGSWWPADYKGPPLVSLDAELARDFRLKLGDTITVNVLGREVTARIASLREIEWSSLSLNFFMLFSPGVLEAAPHSFIATARATPEAEEPLLRAVTDRFVNISAIEVKEALKAAAGILERIVAAVRGTALFTLVVGALVLAGALAAEHQRRRYDSVVLKVLGATRRRLLAAFLIEYGILGLAAGAVAAALGTLAGYLVTTRLMAGAWGFLPWTVFATLLAATALALLMGFLGTWRALAQPAAPYLRNE